MLDKHIIPIVRPLLGLISTFLSAKGITANHMTIAGYCIGLLALPFLAFEQYSWALVAILINRLFDGFDGAIARINGTTDAGGFLDITLDFAFYATVPFGFVLASPNENGIAGAWLLLSFFTTGSSFLAFASFAEKRKIEDIIYQNKSLYYMTGLVEGSETIFFFILCCLLPEYFSYIAYFFGSLCLLTAIYRIFFGFRVLNSIDEF